MAWHFITQGDNGPFQIASHGRNQGQWVNSVAKKRESPWIGRVSIHHQRPLMGTPGRAEQGLKIVEHLVQRYFTVENGLWVVLQP